jgi:hypothetical protein
MVHRDNFTYLIFTYTRRRIPIINVPLVTSVSLKAYANSSHVSHVIILTNSWRGVLHEKLLDNLEIRKFYAFNGTRIFINMSVSYSH